MPVHVNTLRRRHFIFGWVCLLVFLTLGIGLELLHALKLPVYLDVRNTTRRLMWTLAHAHGALFSLIQIAFAATLGSIQQAPPRSLLWVSRGLIGATLTMPLGFLLGGVDIKGGDPGLGILLVPIGALLLLSSVVIFVRILLAQPNDPQKTLSSPATQAGSDEPSKLAPASGSKFKRRGGR